MIKKLLIVLILLDLFSFESKCQDVKNGFYQMLISADTVIIAGHEANEGSLKARGTSSTKLLDKGRPNEAIIHGKVVLSHAAVQKLATIMTEDNKDKTNSTQECFNPHHAIFIIKNGIVSYINVCFDCKNIATSKNISPMDISFNNTRWKKLKSFFIENGIKVVRSEQ